MYIITPGNLPTKRVDRVRTCPRWDVYTAARKIGSTGKSPGSNANSKIRLVIQENPLVNISLVESPSKNGNSFVQDRAMRATAKLKAEETYLSDTGAS